MPDLSIIIVSYNTRKLLLECLNSIYTDYSNSEAEIWVVDNESKDGSLEAVCKQFPQVNLIHNLENIGFVRANNQALRRASGEVCIILNPDTIIQPGAFQILNAAFEHNPNAGMIAPQLLNTDGSIQPSYGHFSSLWTEFFFQFFLFKFLPSPFPLGRKVHFLQQNEYQRAHEVPWATGACLAVRREAVEKAGLLDESIFMYGEDMEWAWRFRQNGYKVFYNPAAKVVHLAQRSSKMDFTRWITNYSLGQLRFIQNHRSSWSTRIASLLMMAGSSLRLLIWSLIRILGNKKTDEAESRLAGYKKVFQMSWKVLVGGTA